MSDSENNSDALFISVSLRNRLLKLLKRNYSLIIIIAGYCLYATAYIYRTSFIINGERYFCLFDDAMISMRYAHNLALGYGLVWNPGGEHIEGYTNSRE